MALGSIKNTIELSWHGINAGTRVPYVRDVLIVGYHSCFDLSYRYKLLVITSKRAHTV